MNPNVDLKQLAVDREPQAPSLRPRRHIVTRYLLPGAVLLGFLGVVSWAARDALLPAQPVTVVPILTERSEVQASGTPLFQAAGWVEPRPTPTLVSALTEGIVDKLLVVEGQQVKAGEPVATLVDADARLALQTAQAELNQREAEADALLAKAEADRAFLPYQVQSAEARQKLARIEVERKKAAYNALPAVSQDHAERELVTADAALGELKLRKQRLEREADTLPRMRRAGRDEAAPVLAEGPLTQPEANMKVAMTRIYQARLVVDTARLRLDRTTIRAPVAGRVLALLARPGSRLMGMGSTGPADATAAVSLYDPAQLQVRADVRFEDLAGVAPGQPVRIETPAVRAGALQGRVLFATSLADVQKNTLQVKVAIEEPPPVIKPDMLVSVTFLATARPAGPAGHTDALRLLVPRALVDSASGGYQVWVADQAAGMARHQTVKLGASFGDLLEVVDGLTPADKLIAGGRAGLRDGQRIRITGEDPAGTTNMPHENGPKQSRLPANPIGNHKGKH
jgi:RND family efflux transporter MFP subunit